VAAVSDLASAAGDWQSVSSRGRPYKSSHLRVEGEVSRGACFAVCSVSLCVQINMSVNKTSLCLADPWCWWGKPTGSGSRRATLNTCTNLEQRQRTGLIPILVTLLGVTPPPNKLLGRQIKPACSIRRIRWSTHSDDNFIPAAPK